MADRLQGFVFDGADAGGAAGPALLRFKGRVRGRPLTVFVEGSLPVDGEERLDWTSTVGEAALDKLAGVLARLSAGPVDRDVPASCRLFR